MANSDAQKSDHTPVEGDDKTNFKTKGTLSWPGALFRSVFDADVDFYPRLNRDRPTWPYRLKQFAQALVLRLPVGPKAHGWAASWDAPSKLEQAVVSLKSEDLVRELPEALKSWKSPLAAEATDPLEDARAVLEELVKPGDLTKAQIATLREKAAASLALSASAAPTIDDAIELAKMSFGEVKDQTEYQDQKATRLLTVTTFLSALSGALFATFSSAYPLRMAADLPSWQGPALIAAYATFLAFVIAAIGGALITFHATRTRFKYTKEATAAKQKQETRSFLFYREIIAVSPQGWADSFVRKAGKKSVLHADLKEKYFKNQVVETYLIAAKAADKLRYLGPAQSLLAWALRSLFLFVVLIAVIQTFVPRQEPKPSDVRLLAPGRPIPVSIPGFVRIDPQPAAPAGQPKHQSQAVK